MIRSVLSRMFPGRRRSPSDHSGYEKLSVEDTFRQIYQKRVWGSNGQQFYSGPGSHGPASDMYCDAITEFIREQEIQRVVDLGCGDFSVGRRIVEGTDADYIGVDVVSELIAHHSKTFVDPRVSFLCANIITDDLPVADLCLIRQVLQHLTNDEIAEVLKRLAHFPKVIIAEDIPSQPISFNLDMTHGPDARADFGSGVYIDRPPFSFPVTDIGQVPLTETRILRIVLIDNVARTMAA